MYGYVPEYTARWSGNQADKEALADIVSLLVPLPQGMPKKSSKAKSDWLQPTAETVVKLVALNT